MKLIFKERFLMLLLLTAITTTVFAQRFTDNLNRGLVAVVPRNGSGVFLSWRIQPYEYYDVTYTVLCNGTPIATGLTVSNYYHESGNVSNTYQVISSKETASTATPANRTKVFSIDPRRYKGQGEAFQPGYLRIPMKDVVDRNNVVVYSVDGTTCTWDYTLNDACCADLDGDGEVEIIVKRINQTDASAKYPNGTAKQLYETSNTTAYTIFEAYKIDGTRLWWIDCGPNMVSQNSTELNCVAYDWDEDGKAEVIMRGADNMIIHTSDGKAIQVGGDVNLRDQMNSHTQAQYAWTHTGKEYLLYLDGVTAEPLEASRYNSATRKYTPMDFPLRRIEGYTDEQLANMTFDEQKNLEKAQWDCDYGHKSSKYFFGAPFLDGRHASVFLARGIYSQIKMTALDVNTSTHELTVRTGWPWTCSTASSKWYGQGYHNYSIADVDEDGCDEIIYGSMVIDNNGKGLSTTGLGHGDAHHVGDLDPYTKGLEIFACNEDNPANNFRNATTSNIYFRREATGDDGRALMGNFTNEYPGCVGRSASMPVSDLISSVAHKVNNTAGSIDGSGKGFLNGRIYWDGDLLEEYYTSTGTEKDCAIAKINDWRVLLTSGVGMINDSKNNPCAQGDILGDWREELVLRSSDNKELRIYTTDESTEWRIPSLWYDHQYRQAMVWQVCAYNQPPHTSFFLGEMEGITRAPLPLTNTDRIEIHPEGEVLNHNGKTVLLADEGNYGIFYENTSTNVTPAMVVVNASSEVSGTNNSNTTSVNAPSYSYKTITLGTGSLGNGILSGTMRLIKQGDGILKLSNRTHTYSGDTEIWGGTVMYYKNWQNSNIWMNRNTNLFYGGTDAYIKQSLTMEYGATLHIDNNKTTVNATPDYQQTQVNVLNMNEGSRIRFEINPSQNKFDKLTVTTLNIRKQNWEYGPKYLAPVFEIVSAAALSAGEYNLGNIANIGSGDIDDIIVECDNSKLPANSITYIERKENGDIYFVVKTGASITTEDISVYKLDFQETNIEYINGESHTTGSNFGFYETVTNGESSTSNVTTIIENVDNNKFIHFYTNDKTRAERLSFASIEDFSNNCDYKFEFDLAMVSGNTDNSIFQLNSMNGTLFTVEVVKFANKGTVKSADGTVIGEVDVDVYNNPNTLSSAFVPTKFYTYTVRGTVGGNVALTVTPKSNSLSDPKISNKEVYSSFATVMNIKADIGRYHSHIAMDNITLNQYSPVVLIKESEYPRIPAGTYSKVEVERSKFKAGYNTFCIPMNTTPAAVAGTNAKAYKFSRVQSNGNTSSLIFEEVNEIEANKPYLIYCQNEVAIPTLFNNVTVSVAKSVEVEADGWKFVSNYTPAKSMTGNYVVYNDNDGGKLRHCGTNTFLNGLRAYFVGPSNASAKTLMLSFEDVNGIVDTIIPDDETNGVVGIYNVSGISHKSLVKGINIVKMINGSVRKIYIK